MLKSPFRKIREFGSRDSVHATPILLLPPYFCILPLLGFKTTLADPFFRIFAYRVTSPALLAPPFTLLMKYTSLSRTTKHGERVLVFGLSMGVRVLDTPMRTLVGRNL
jgi:hypothetical protein